MVYVDLNPIRAGLAGTPEESDFTSIQERIRAWRKETMTTGPAPSEAAAQPMHSASVGRRTTVPENTAEIPDSIPDRLSVLADPLDGWLCPIQSESGRRGILQMTTAEYFDLVDKSGRMMRSDKRGAIDADLAPMLLRIGANPDAWLETVSRFGSKFRLAAGLVSSLRNFADRSAGAGSKAPPRREPPSHPRRCNWPDVMCTQQCDPLQICSLLARPLSALFPTMSSSLPVTALPV